MREQAKQCSEYASILWKSINCSIRWGKNPTEYGEFWDILTWKANSWRGGPPSLSVIPRLVPEHPPGICWKVKFSDSTADTLSQELWGRGAGTSSQLLMHKGTLQLGKSECPGSHPVSCAVGPAQSLKIRICSLFPGYILWTNTQEPRWYNVH